LLINYTKFIKPSNPAEKLEKYSGWSVLEEMALLLIEKEIPKGVGLNIVVTQSEEVVPELISQPGFSGEQLYLTFKLYRDVADQLRHQKILKHWHIQHSRTKVVSPKACMIVSMLLKCRVKNIFLGYGIRTLERVTNYVCFVINSY